mmetsp:Transcript_5874/g.9508  ORF Transcript_5874/g.9508 Transcript_5874/m.9508 type:complete len:232 (-) Transcript_5874:73-768(-)
MAANGATEQARYKGMLESLQSADPEIIQIEAFSKFVVAYLLQQDGPQPGWRKANIEGPLYLVRRRVAPRFQLIVKNQFSPKDLLDDCHGDWELDCQKNYVFYKVEDATKRIRGLWFHDDSERAKIETALEKTLEEIRSKPHGDPEPLQQKPRGRQEENSQTDPTNGAFVDSLYAQFGLTKPNDPMVQQAPVVSNSANVQVTRESLSAALHELADDDNFLDMVLNKLKEVLR